MTLQVQLGTQSLPGELTLTPGAEGLVLIVHGRTAGRRDPGWRRVAAALPERELCALSFSLLDAEEERHGPHELSADEVARRIGDVLDWMSRRPAVAHLPVGLLGLYDSAPGCVAALSRQPRAFGALMLVDGWIDPQQREFASVRRPCLLVAHGADEDLVQRQRAALARLRGPRRLELLPRAPSPAGEPQHDAVAALAGAWFADHLHVSTPKAA